MCCTSEIKALQLSEVTNALLDSCSQGTFVTEQILKELDGTGIKTSIDIKTLNDNQKVSSTLSGWNNGIKAGLKYKGSDSLGKISKIVHKKGDTS